uniref:Uncharacterized protein n=1 Tax=Oryza rufipogon TaxID=4529 RepID=A0A0E0QE02_ORYRU
MDEDVIFLLSITSPMKTDRLEVVFAVDVRKGMLQGLAKLDVRPKNLAIMEEPLTLTGPNNRVLGALDRIELHLKIRDDGGVDQDFCEKPRTQCISYNFLGS